MCKSFAVHLGKFGELYWIALSGWKSISTLDRNVFKHSQLKAAKALKCERKRRKTDVQELAIMCYLDFYKKISMCRHASIKHHGHICTLTVYWCALFSYYICHKDSQSLKRYRHRQSSCLLNR